MCNGKCSEKRKVRVYEWVMPESVGQKQKHVRSFKCNALFHQFGSDYEEFENGAVNYSTAIVEYEDGSIGNIEVGMVEFIKEGDVNV